MYRPNMATLEEGSLGMSDDRFKITHLKAPCQCRRIECIVDGFFAVVSSGLKMTHQ